MKKIQGLVAVFPQIREFLSRLLELEASTRPGRCWPPATSPGLAGAETRAIRSVAEQQVDGRKPVVGVPGERS
jgi:hypothetical protein